MGSVDAALKGRSSTVVAAFWWCEYFGDGGVSVVAAFWWL